MSKKQTKLISLVLISIIGLSAWRIAPGFAHPETQEASVLTEGEKQTSADLTNSKSAIFLQKLQAELAQNQDELGRVNNSLNNHNQKLLETKKEINSLEAELTALGIQITVLQKQIAEVKENIKEKKLEIQFKEQEIEENNVKMAYQKQLIANYLEAVYLDRNKIGNFNEGQVELSTVKLLLGQEKAGEMLKNLHYSEILEEEGRGFFEELNNLAEQDELQRKILYLKQFNLQKLESSLKDKEANLEETKQIKANLLEQTKGQEKIYQEIITEFKQQQSSIEEEIHLMSRNISFVREKMQQLGDNFNPEAFAAIFEGIDRQKLDNYLKNNAGEFTPIWPIQPIRGISAYYQDQSYLAHFGFRHNAIDIPTSQATPIKAAADGMVYKAVDNGLGYSYIILIHKKGYMTAYGHVFDIMVKKGDIVSAGDIIGLSGGMPKTKGAGPYTTGPHLHFEIIKDGKHVDPMNYVNLAQIDLSKIPEKYISKAVADREMVRRTVKNQEKVPRKRKTVEELVDQNGEKALEAFKTEVEYNYNL